MHTNDNLDITHVSVRNIFIYCIIQFIYIIKLIHNLLLHRNILQFCS